MIFVLRVPYNGLGDQLFYSPIPGLIKSRFPNSLVKVKLERGTRNTSIVNMVWKSNPYVDGICTESDQQWPLPSIKKTQADNILASFAKSLGLHCSENLLPEIHTKINLDENFIGKIVVDLNYVSFVGGVSQKKLIRKFNDPNIYFVNRPDWIEIGTNIQPTSLTHYASIIKSSEEFHCLTSGGATLAAALRKPSKCYFGRGQDKIFHHCDFHDYIEMSDYSMNSIMKLLKYKTYTRIKRKFLEITGDD